MIKSIITINKTLSKTLNKTIAPLILSSLLIPSVFAQENIVDQHAIEQQVIEFMAKEDKPSALFKTERLFLHQRMA